MGAYGSLFAWRNMDRSDKILYNKMMRNYRYDKANEFLRLLYKENQDVSKEIKQFRQERTAEVKSGNFVDDNLRLLFDSYMITAKDIFDDYMIALEWNRVPQAQFWLPRRRILEEKFQVATKIQNFLDGDNGKLLTISCPPGVGKTTLIKFLLSFIAGKYPESANMYASYSDGMVKMVYDSVVSIMIDDTEYNFDKIFGLGEPKCSAEYSTISYRKKGDFATLGLVSIGGSVTGRTRANKFFITDDLVKNDEMARSPERLETLWSDYNNTLTTRMIGDNPKQVMLGTIWSLYDPISRQREKYYGKEGYEFIALPVKDADGHSNFCYDHPDRYTDERIQDLEDRLDPVVFSCVYMQQGIEKEGLAFSADRLKFYNGVLPDGEPDNILFFGDVAWGGGDSFSMPIAYVYGEDVYIHDVLFDKGDKSITKPRVIGKIFKNNVKMGRFEANNGGMEFAEDVSKKLFVEYNYSCAITSCRGSASHVPKLTRIEQHQDTIRRFIFRADGYRDKEYDRFMQELQTFSFTAKNKHDDAPDSLAGLCEYKFKGNSAAEIIKRRF